jgi:hypothetical protein
VTARKTQAKRTTRKTAGRKKATRTARQPKSPGAKRARKKTPRGKKDPGGRPAIVWSDDVVKTVAKLARFGNTVEDIARVLNVAKPTLEEAISKEPAVREAYYSGGAKLNGKLRRAQVNYALEGNAALLRWLGIQRLGQRDVKAVELTGSGEDGAVKVEGDLGPIVAQKVFEFLRSKGKR